MPNYTYATLTDAIDALASRLYDVHQQFWSPAELPVYITEALRTWNALTSFWRAEMVFPLAQGSWWYDLTAQPGSLRPFTVTPASIIQAIEYHLLEPLTASYPLTWTGSKQFAVSDILDSMTRRQNEALGTSGCTITRSIVNAPISPGRVVLADTTIDVRRVAWLPVTGQGFSNKIIRQSDIFAKRAFNPTYPNATQQPPSNWMQNTEPPPSFDVDRVPPVDGNYEVMSVNSGAVFNSTTTALLSVPDDWSWIVKWGALQDLLSHESNAKDALRAKYCEQRYQEGLALLYQAPALLGLRLNNNPMGVDAVRNGDDFNASWQAQPQGAPASAYAMGLNQLAFAPAPDAVAYSATASVVQNAPVPAAPGDFIQVSREDYDTILDYAQHLAAFKMGGAEFAATVPLYQRFLRRASLYNSKLTAMGFFEKEMQELSQFQQERDPTFSSPTPSDPVNG